MREKGVRKLALTHTYNIKLTMQFLYATHKYAQDDTTMRAGCLELAPPPKGIVLLKHSN